MAETLIHGHDSTMNDYMGPHYGYCELRDHVFYPTISVPGMANMTVHMWSMCRFVPLREGSEFDTLKRVYYFSVYENGAIINPESDKRFMAAYDAHVADHKRPWIECYFMRLRDISSFLRQCDIVS